MVLVTAAGILVVALALLVLLVPLDPLDNRAPPARREPPVHPDRREHRVLPAKATAHPSLPEDRGLGTIPVKGMAKEEDRND